MRSYAKLLVWILPVLASQLAASWWTHPDAPLNPGPSLELLVPEKPDGWSLHPELYREVQPSLHCNNGWIANLDGSSGPAMRVAYFKWDRASTLNTLEAFKHLPEQCMASIGMELEKIYPGRRLESSGQTLVFDSTLFRPHGGGQSVHVFKCVWVGGLESADLREGVLLGNNGTELRRLRLSAAFTRFKPEHTRVIMGSVAGMPSEELAWRSFSSSIRDRLIWQKPGSE